jgi:hypothetical protein
MAKEAVSPNSQGGRSWGHATGISSRSGGTDRRMTSIIRTRGRGSRRLGPYTEEFVAALELGRSPNEATRLAAVREFFDRSRLPWRTAGCRGPVFSTRPGRTPLSPPSCLGGVAQYRHPPPSAWRRPWPRRCGYRCDRRRGVAGPRQGGRSAPWCSPACARATSL